ncbi:hypothetical protein IWW38_004237, partial [Coemansia aciculifera]
YHWIFNVEEDAEPIEEEEAVVASPPPVEVTADAKRDSLAPPLLSPTAQDDMNRLAAAVGQLSVFQAMTTDPIPIGFPASSEYSSDFSCDSWDTYHPRNQRPPSPVYSNLTVWFPQLRTCAHCHVFETIKIHPGESLKQVRATIADHLKLRADEFLFDIPGMTPDTDLDTRFNSAVTWDNVATEPGVTVKVYRVGLVDNPGYKGTTGTLRAILNSEETCYSSVMPSCPLSPALSVSSDSTQSTCSLVRVEVTFSVWHQDSHLYNYEAFAIYPLDDTIREFSEMVAGRLGIEADEFMFEGRKKKWSNELDADISFAEFFYSSKAIAQYEAGKMFRTKAIRLYANPKYKGTTGMLKWILAREIPPIYTYADDEGDGEYVWRDPDGMLADVFADSIAAYKAAHGVPLVSPVDSVDNE